MNVEIDFTSFSDRFPRCILPFLDGKVCLSPCLYIFIYCNNRCIFDNSSPLIILIQCSYFLCIFWMPNLSPWVYGQWESQQCRTRLDIFVISYHVVKVVIECIQIRNPYRDACWSWIFVYSKSTLRRVGRSGRWWPNFVDVITLYYTIGVSSSFTSTVYLKWYCSTETSWHL